MAAQLPSLLLSVRGRRLRSSLTGNAALPVTPTLGQAFRHLPTIVAVHADVKRKTGRYGCCCWLLGSSSNRTARLIHGSSARLFAMVVLLLWPEVKSNSGIKDDIYNVQHVILIFRIVR